MNKKVVASIIMMVMVLSGCGRQETITLPEQQSIESTVMDAPVEKEAVVENPVTEDSVVAEVIVPDLEVENFEIPDNEALAFVKNMKIGWNLGNTFDTNTEDKQVNDEMTYETMWCGVKTTKEMIDTVKAAGFNTVRIPVSWHNHLVDEAFTISEEWMNRVQEVVDYVIDNDMYAIINIHHDINKAYYYPSSDYIDNSKKYVTSIWSQISERFKAYDEYLIFESVNEPRLVGDSNEWWFEGDKENCQDAARCINILNQVFVDTVRGSGSRNATRYLMVPGYDAAADPVLYEGFELPKDTQDNKIIVSVHAYTPYAFALQGPLESGSTANWDVSSIEDQKSVTDFMDGLYNKFIINGIPVLIGEFGARDKQDNLQARVDFATYYVAAARVRGMSCCLWDNNSFVGNGENFGLLQRGTNTWQYAELVEGLMKYAD